MRGTSHSKGHAASPCLHAQEPSHGTHTSLVDIFKGEEHETARQVVPYARACVWGGHHVCECCLMMTCSVCLNETTTAHGGCTPHCMSMWASCHRHTRSSWPCGSHRGALVVRGDGHGECAAHVCRTSIQGETTHNAHKGPGREEVGGGGTPC